jgi:hypothetical protein
MSHDSILFVIIVLVARLAWLVISWCAGLSMERARARGLAALTGAARPGVTVIERSADGSVVVVVAAADGTGRDEFAQL